ncbi:MAG TPA: DNA-directed RNA polymerase subunit beta, partial [Desulfobacteria bacterium]|nr:DNA-directed RNA polymerase subunit beta [Desulfobacteria bacterium]
MFKNDGVRRRARKSFGKISKVIETPNLIAMQRQSYERYLQQNIPPEEREDVGLQAAYMGVFPIHDFAGTSSLEFVKYAFEGAKYSEEDCLSKGMTYEASLRLTVRLVVFDTDTVSETKSIRDIKEQEIYFGTLPIMTDRGTFIINGTERAVVSQLHRSPGAFFDHDKGKTHASGKLLYSARIIPLRGSWLDFEFDPKDFLYVRIDRRRKFPVTILLKALGYTAKDLLYHFYDTEMIEFGETGGWRETIPSLLNQEKVAKAIVGEDEEIVAKKGVKFTKRLLKTLAVNEASKPRIPIVKWIPFEIEKGAQLQVVGDISDPETGDILVSDGSMLSPDEYALLEEKGISQVKCLDQKRIRIPVELEDIENRVICDDLIDPETGEILLEGNSHLTKEKIES